ncbi:hypothetical protein GGF46_002125 [Coemansia sp. RSA 552]|nr:hypothetical protein GGF46_004749 [Coemansia sp. RSA 552]KAJ2160632.1 hypothetical protein GGF46_002125 [Coemansia sp. RSA 552]
MSVQCNVVIMGFGLGLNIQILLTLIQTAAPVEDMASATSLFLFMRAMDSSIGIAALQSVPQNAIYQASMPADLQALLFTLLLEHVLFRLLSRE